jgi:hypothetical protein
MCSEYNSLLNVYIMPIMQADSNDSAKGTKGHSVFSKARRVAALGGLLFGFDTAVIAGTTHALTETFHLTPALLGTTVSSALWEYLR